MSELPQHWALARVGDLVDLGPKNDCTDDTEVGFVPLHRLGVDYRSRHSFERKPWSAVKKGYTHFANGDVLLARITPSFENGKAGIVRGLPNGIGAGSTEYFVCRPLQGAVLPEYLLAHFKTPPFLRDGEQVMSGAVGQQRVPKQYVIDSEIPLAPFNEQKRIADKLDALLARVDACREHLDRVPAILKRFRRSVLSAATSGNLTEEWRNTAARDLPPWREAVTKKAIPLPKGCRRLTKQSFKPIPIDHAAVSLPPKWDVTTIGDLYKLNVLIDFADGNHGSLYPRKEEFGDEGALFLTATQIGEQWELNARTCPRLRSDRADKLTKGWAHAGDVLLTHNATVGRVALLDDIGEDVLLGTSVTFYRFNRAFFEPRFARVIFSSQFFQDQLESVMKQTTRDQVPITKQVSLNVICPPIEEQQEIVRRVESLFAFADRLEARSTAARAQVECLTPALLTKAFRGELVPQDPNDESASVLLECIRTSRSARLPKSRQRKLDSRVNRAEKVEDIMLKRKDIKATHLTAILKERGPITAEALWAASQLDIDDFYDQLKDEEARGLLKEKRAKSPTAPRTLEAS